MRYSPISSHVKTEIEQILQKYGSKEVNGIKYENFREFMIDLLGVTDTKEDILNSFKLLNKGEECAKIERFEWNEDIYNWQIGGAYGWPRYFLFQGNR